jgi:hypothetical protein
MSGTMIRMVRGSCVPRWFAASLAFIGLLVAMRSISPPRTYALGPRQKTVEIIVDATSGADTNPGTPDRPVKTVSQAAQIALLNRRSGISTIVTIRPGTYREFVRIAAAGADMGASIAFQASQIGASMLSGSDLWADWQLDSTNSRIYVHPWQYHWGLCEHPSGAPPIKDLGRRREMVFVDGVPLMQALSRGEMKEGSFFIDEASGVALLWPPAGANMSAAKIEVAVRPGVFESNGVSNLSVKGLVFEHANSCHSTNPNAAVVISGGTNNLVEDAVIRWNNWIGFDYWGAVNSTARKLTANWNGELGINGFRLKNATFEDVETSHNNWRGAEGQFTGWEPSGGKFLRVHGAAFRDYSAIGNQGRGMWFDTDNLDITIDHATIEQNLAGGIDLEANMGPVTIRNSRICNNRKEGIQNNQTANVTITQTEIYNNDTAQIMVVDIHGPRSGTNWETKEPFSALPEHWVLSGNIVVAGDAKEMLYEALGQSNPALGTFLSTLKSDGNVWFNPGTPRTFQIDPGAPGEQAKVVNFSQWQSITGQDKMSKFGSPDTSTAAFCAVP